MKSIKLLIVFALCTIYGCEQKESEAVIQDKSLIFSITENGYYDVQNDIQFNTSLVNSRYRQEVLTTTINETLNSNFEHIAGVSIYYEYITGQKIIQANSIIGYGVYFIENNSQLRHAVFKYDTDTNKFVLVVSAMEKLMDTKNQIYVFKKYLNVDKLEFSPGVKNIVDVELDRESFYNGRSELSMIRVREVFSGVNFTDRKVVLEVGLKTTGNCNGPCDESGDGTCDGGQYCDTGSGCLEEDSQDQVVERGLLSSNVAELLFNKDLHTQLRDDLMSQYNIGSKYINYYYALSDYVIASDYNVALLGQMISTLPDFNGAVEKILDPDTPTSDIIIDANLKNDILAIISEMRNISSDINYNQILNEIENDIVYISEKDKGTVLSELY